MLLSSCVTGFATTALAENNYFTVEKIDCTTPVTGNTKIELFSQVNQIIWGWNHIASSATEFANVQFGYDSDKYRVDNSSIQHDTSCEDEFVYKTILVKKYANWDHQHANGLGYDFDQEVAFGQLQDIVIDLKLNSAETHIDHQEFLDSYSEIVSQDVLEQIDRGKFNLGIALNGQLLPDNTDVSFNGSIIIELDQSELSDQWLRLVIPAEAFTYYTQKGYDKVTDNLSVNDYQTLLLQGIRINPETTSGLVLRHKISSEFENLNVTEHFKEEGISIHNLSLRLKETDSSDNGSSGDGSDGNSGSDDSGSSDNGNDNGSSDNGNDSGSADNGNDSGSSDNGNDSGSSDNGNDNGSADNGNDSGSEDNGSDDTSDDNSDNSSSPVYIEQLSSCEEIQEPALSSFMIFDQSVDHLTNDDSHWIKDKYMTQSWSKVYDTWEESEPNVFKFMKDDYSVKLDSLEQDDQCDNLQVMKTILVKKYADWDSQHMSGLEFRFPAANLKFGDLKDIVLEAKINSSQTFIPSREDYLNTYSSYTSTANLEAMDQGKINFGVTLFGENSDDQSIETFHGAITLELDQDTVADQWLRIVIPANSLSYFMQKDWGNTDKDPKDYADFALVGFRINPETHTNQVLRNFITDTFDSSVPEMYKEEGLSVRKVAIRANGVISPDVISDDTEDNGDTSNGPDTDADNNTDSTSSSDDDSAFGSFGMSALLLLAGLFGYRRNKRAA
ncbi:hypothetical Protein YC6258_04224 [Gynuella sunshinyii YC6258]|uniref:Uncharacterized protein n=1 Tax=Gynuella sunshinyii YC6258 TaxID=1445510 RepID=A0A0C5VSH9_9GAMM|nr:hypothetical Protein YC6258_04224 [Gynuella sunshinyii YC6258]